MRTTTLFWIIRGLTALLLLLVWTRGAGEPSVDPTILAGVLIALGIPHGAADHLIFRGSREEVGSSAYFLLYYGMLVLAYGVMWYFLPAVALLLFIATSVYHFGQSHRSDSEGVKHSTVAWLPTVAWGSFVLGFPVLWHFAEAAPIIERMLGYRVVMAEWLPKAVAIGLLLWNVAVYRERRLLDLALLLALYLSTDLLVGFAVYFLLWHSVPAGREQWMYLRRLDIVNTFGGYVAQLAPLSVGAAIILGGGYWWLHRHSGVAVDMGVLFMLISLITLPHTFLVDRVYR